MSVVRPEPDRVELAASGIERSFLGWDAPALPRAAALLCDRYAGVRAIRLDRAVVALPGARAGRRLKELLLEQSERRRLPLVPPRITTIGALPELLYDPDRPHAEPALARMVWAEALRAAPADRVAAVFSRRPPDDALADWAGLAREVARLHREVAGAGLRFREVAARCASSPIFDDGGRWEVLGEVQAEYEARLAGLGWSDPDLSRLDAVEGGTFHSDRDLWLVGVAEMPEVVRRIIGGLAAADPVRALIHAPADRGEAFDEFGCVRAAAWQEVPIPVEESRLSVQDRPEHQATEAARWLSRLDARYAADEIVVGVPNREVVPYAEERLSGAGVAIHDAAGESVARSGPFRLLGAVADYLDGGRFEALAALTRHPDLWPWIRAQRAGDGAGALAHPDGWLPALDGYFSEHLPARIAGPLPGDGNDRHRDAAAAFVALLERALLEPLRGTRRLSDCALAALELLSRIYGVRTLDADVPADRRLIAALGAIGEAAAAFRRLPRPLDPPCPAATAIRLVLNECSGASIPSDPERVAVELLGWLELHLDDAPVTVVTGVNEPHLPESVNADAFLPNGLRTLLGLVDNDRRYARDAYQLTALLHSREEVRLISGRRSATGDPLRPSRLLFATDPATLARRIRSFYDDEPVSPTKGSDRVVDGISTVGSAAGDGPSSDRVPDGSLDRLSESRPAATDRPEQAAGDGPNPEEPAGAPKPERVPDFDTRQSSQFQLPPEPIIHPAHPITRLRVTDFRTLLQDPYGFALQRLLRLEPMDDAAREMDPQAFGGLGHRVLERFGRSDEVHSTDPAAIFGRLEALLDVEANTRFGRNAHVAVRVQVEQLRARLRRFAAWQADWIADGWQVRAVECDTGGDGVPFDVDGEPILLSARIDRVDYHAGSDAWAVFDYKTGDSGDPPEKTHRRGRGNAKEWCDLQLPLYRRLLPSLVDADGRAIAPDALDGDVRLGYIVLPRDLDATGAAFAVWTTAELEEAEEVARAIVRRIRTEPFRFDRKAPRPKWSDPRMDALLGRRQLAAGDDDADDAAGAEDS